MLVPLHQASVQNLQLLLRPQLGFRSHPLYGAARPPGYPIFFLQYPSQPGHLRQTSYLLSPPRQFFVQYQRSQQDPSHMLNIELELTSTGRAEDLHLD